MYHQVSLAAFNLFLERDAGDFQELYQGITMSGYLIFSLIMRIGIWSALMALLFIGYRLMLNSGHIKLREENKKIVTKYVIVVLLLLNIVGIVSIVLKSGLDMW